MKLRVLTPLCVVVDEDGVEALRAEDATGGFGLLPGHADFLTSFSVSVVSWRRHDGTRRYCAVRHGTVVAGDEISIATREAVLGDSYATLEPISRRSGPSKLSDRARLPAFPRRAETRDRRRRERQPCRRQDPGARAARGREDPAARLCAVSGTRNVHALRRHAGCARQRPIDARIRAIFEQSQHAPLRLAEEVALVLALQGGVLDAIPPGAIAGFHSGLRAALDRDLPDAVRQVQQTGALHEANKPAVLATLRAYSKRFAQTAGRPV